MPAPDPQSPWSLEGLPRPGLSAVLCAGTMLDEYRILESIAVGGMGAVYRACDTNLDRAVAIKILPPELAVDEEIAIRFTEEGRAAAQLDHENIARIYALGHAENLHYIVFEFIEGRNLKQIVDQSGPLDSDSVVTYARQIALALRHASRRGVVHRDIKPSNIIVTWDGGAKLVDMGLARRFERGDFGNELTASGTHLGTFDYISPEQARDPRDVDVRSDLYSLGCTMFQSLIGRPPYPGGTVLQKLLQHQEDPIPDLRQLDDQIPEGLAEIIARLMQKDRALRYQSPDELIEALDLLDGTGLEHDSDVDDASNSTTLLVSGWLGHLYWAVPALTFLLLFAAAFLWLYQQQRSFGDSFASQSVFEGDLTFREVQESTGTLVDPRALQTTPEFDDESSDSSILGAPEPGPSRVIRVASTDDLGETIRQAPHHSEIILTDPGPYRLTTQQIDSGTTGPIVRRQTTLTLRADEGLDGLRAPTVILTDISDAQVPRNGDAEVLRFEDAVITMQGLVFQLDGSPMGWPLTGLVAQDTDLTLQDCVFQGPVGQTSRGPGTLIGLRVITRNDQASARIEPSRIELCRFADQLTAIESWGPTVIAIRDSVLLGSGPLIRTDEAFDDDPEVDPLALERPIASRARVTLDRVSLALAPDAVGFQIGRPTSIRLDDSLIGQDAEGNPGFVLVETRNPRLLDWFGRGTIYQGVESFLVDSTASTLDVRTFDAWVQGGRPIREVDATWSDQTIWAGRVDPSALVDRERLQQVLSLNPRVMSNRGTIKGALLDPRDPYRLAIAQRAIAGPGTIRTEGTEIPNPFIPDPLSSSEPSPTPSDDQRLQPVPTDPESMVREPLGFWGDIEGETDFESFEDPRDRQMPNPNTNTLSAQADQAVEPIPNEATSSTIRSFPIAISDPDALRRALAEPPRDGEPLILESGTEIVLDSTITIDSEDEVILRAAPSVDGSARPVLIFQPSADGPEPFLDHSQAERGSLIRLQQGTLRLEGIDLILEDRRAVVDASDRRGASGWLGLFQVDRGTVTLRDVTLTAVSRRGAVRLLTVPEESDPPKPEPFAFEESDRPVRIRIERSRLRSDGRGIVAPLNRSLELDLDQVVVVTGGALIASEGRGVGVTPHELTLTFNRVTSINLGGLARIESDPLGPPPSFFGIDRLIDLDRIDLPPITFRVTDSILSTDGGREPLIGFLSNGDNDAILERVRWRSLGVAYHRIETYRRDRQHQKSPTLYDLARWTMLVGSRDDEQHGDVGLDVADLIAEEVSPSSWPADAFSIRDDAPAQGLGPRLNAIPLPSEPNAPSTISARLDDDR